MNFGNHKKGISPLIATVLVIGFTIVLAGVVMQFIMPLFVQSGEKAKADAALMRMCSDFGVSLAIKSAVYNAGTTPTPDTFNVVVDNPTSTDIEQLSLKLYLVDGSAKGCLLKGSGDGNNPLITANGIQSITLPTTPVPPDNVDKCPNIKVEDLPNVKSVEVTPSVWMKDTKEVKTCTSATVSANV